MYPSPPLAIAHTSNPVTSEHPGQPISNPKQKLSYQQSPDIGRAACASCRRRKIKCDKISPCTNCVRACISCDAAVRKRAPRRPRSTLAGSGELREKVLLRRLDCLEDLVKELKGQATVGERTTLLTPGTSPVDGGRAVSMESGARSGKSQEASSFNDAVGRTHDETTAGESTGYRDSSFWGRITEEVNNIRHLVLDELSEDTGSPEWPPLTNTASLETDSQCAFMFGYRSTDVDLASLHPLPSQLLYYLQVFKERVDPFIKILHMPTMEKLVREVQANPDNISKGVESLMFSMYFAVVTSMSTSEVKQNLAFEKKALSAKYKFGIEQALARASFLESSELIVLQALVIYLGCIWSQDEGRTGCVLTRLAIGIAEWMGLHRDGSNFGLPPFECEMRRRLWWLLCVLDSRNAERYRTRTIISVDSFDTKVPLNINDEDIDVDAVVAPVPRKGFTDMTSALLATDIFSAVNRLQKRGYEGANIEGSTSGRFSDEESIVHSFSQELEQKYIQPATNSQLPLAQIVTLACQRIIAKMTLVQNLALRRKVGKVSKDLNDKIFVTTIRCIELRYELESDGLKPWQWFFRAFPQCDAVAFLLRELGDREEDESTARAWNVLDLVFNDWVDSQIDWPQSKLTSGVMNLIARARAKRGSDLIAGRSREHADGHEPLDNLNAHQDIAEKSEGCIAEEGNSNDHSYLLLSDLPHGTNGYPQEWFLEHQQQQELTDYPASYPWLMQDPALDNLDLVMSTIDDEMGTARTETYGFVGDTSIFESSYRI